MSIKSDPDSALAQLYGPPSDAGSLAKEPEAPDSSSALELRLIALESRFAELERFLTPPSQAVDGMPQPDAPSPDLTAAIPADDHPLYAPSDTPNPISEIPDDVSALAPDILKLLSSANLWPKAGEDETTFTAALVQQGIPLDVWITAAPHLMTVIPNFSLESVKGWSIYSRLSEELQKKQHTSL